MLVTLGPEAEADGDLDQSLAQVGDVADVPPQVTISKV